HLIISRHVAIEVKSRAKIKPALRGPGMSLAGGRKFPVYEPRFERFNKSVTEQKKIFGTDGVRGIANVDPVTAETALKLGRAVAYVFAQLNPRRTPAGARPKIVLGKDTRLSGYMLENALVAGITSLGVDVLVIGP